jgi:hypothetical protein
VDAAIAVVAAVATGSMTRTPRPARNPSYSHVAWRIRASS